MKLSRKSLLLLIVLTISTVSLANPIDSIIAKTVAFNFLKSQKTLSVENADEISIFEQKSFIVKQNGSTLNYPLYYVLNCGTDGFVIVAGDDNVEPILGYGFRPIMKNGQEITSVKTWLELYGDQILFIVENGIIGDEQISNLWNNYLSSNATGILRRAGSVAPLLKTTWNQSPYYNDQCPFDYSANERSITGCVATAMAQVMKFWNFPKTGSGSHSYNHSDYGTLYADFGASTYDWNSMPNYLSSKNSAVAEIMSHSGISVNMDYSPDGSGAYVISAKSPYQNCAEYALKTYFDYSSTLSGKEKKSFTESNWLSLLKSDLDAGRPIIYAGFGPDGGHCFVCDGYNNNDYFHFNWGWGGTADGYFKISALNPQTSSYTSGQQALIGVEPSTTIQSYSLDINKSVTISSSTITYGSSFTITANIKNTGSNTFKGTYCAAVFDANGSFIDYVDSIVESKGLLGGYTYTNNLSFTNSGSVKIVPGAYTVYLYYKPLGGSWKKLYASGFFTSEKVSLKVTHTNTIELYSNITPASEYLTQGSPSSVNLNVQNKGTYTFQGFYQLALFDLNGNFVETIGTIEEKNGLSPNYIYSSPYLTFKSTSISAEPGTYLMALFFADVLDTNYYLVGSKNYSNPIYINVIAPPYRPDKYENNDNISIAYSLPINFSNNKATVSTSASNIHVENDIDFYKLELSPGYTYSITPRLHDQYNSDLGDTFSIDALFTYSADNGTNWSESFDDIFPSTISANAGNLFFKITPFFIGETGEYQIVFSITRTPKLAKDQFDEDLISIYPNPSWNGSFTISGEHILKVIGVCDNLGRNVNHSISRIDNKYNLMLDNCIPGIYFIEIETFDNERKTFTVKTN